MGAKASDVLSEHFKSEDVRDEGDYVLTVKAYELREFPREGKAAPERKYALSFVEEERKLFCNKTAVRTLRTAWSNDLDDWVGRRLRLYYDPDIYFGERKVGGLRVEPLDDE